jgi:hypothetical protein
MSDYEFYVRGESINNFLKKSGNFSKNYCLVLNFDPTAIGVSYKQLRARAEPISQTFFLTQEVERMLKIHFQDYKGNKLNCSGSAINVDGTPIALESEVAYKSDGVCTSNCNSILSGLYTSASQTISESTKVTDPLVSVLKLIIGGELTIGLSTTLGGYYYKTSDNVSDVRCQPKPEAIPTPFQDLKLQLKARSIPNRFFMNSDGSTVDDIANLYGTPETTTSSLSEGKMFYYNEESRRLGPENVPLNMNAILGHMRVDLTAAIPAKVVHVQAGQTYIISTIDGTYSPAHRARASLVSFIHRLPPPRWKWGLQRWAHSFPSRGDSRRKLWGHQLGTTAVPATMIPLLAKSAAMFALRERVA